MIRHHRNASYSSISALLLTTLSFFACEPPWPSVTVPQIDRVILISIDTLRADFLGSYSPGLDTTPNLNRFASDSVVFTDVLSHAASTATSHKSILYSLYPSVHKASKDTVPTEHVVAPVDALRSAGFTTGAIVGGGQLREEFGLAKGFQDYIVLPPVTRGNQLEAFEEESFKWLAAHRDDKFFLFLHNYEPHCPYDAPEEFTAKRAGWYKGDVDPGQCGAQYYNKLQMGKEDFQFVRDLYAAEVEYLDVSLGRLFDALKRLGLYDSPLIVFTSDHGESLGERRYVGHNRLYNIQLQVPLIIKPPQTVPRAADAPARVDAPIESIDIMPTIFAAMSVTPPFPFQGKSLWPLMTGVSRRDPDRERIASHPNLVSVHRNQWHLLYNPTGQRAELYDFRADPEELDNLAEEHEPIVSELRESFDRMERESQELANQFELRDGGTPVLDESAIEELKALGYIQ